MIKTRLTVLLLFFSIMMFSQTKEEALRDAKIAAMSTLNGDFKTLLNYTHPNVVKFMGGKEKALMLIKSSFASMNEEGFSFEKADVISVSEIVLEQGQYRCYVEGFNQMKMPNARVKATSYLLGFYDPEAKIWSFIEANKINEKILMDKIFPNFETKLNIPDDTMTTETI